MLAQRMGISAAGPARAVRFRVQWLLQRVTGWCLLFDNCSSPALLAEYLPRNRCVPHCWTAGSGQPRSPWSAVCSAVCSVLFVQSAVCRPQTAVCSLWSTNCVVQVVASVA